MLWLRPIMASVQPELGRIVYAGSDILHPIRFHSSKEGLDGLVRFQPSASGLEASQCARIFAPASGRIPLAHCQFLIFRLGCSLPQMAWIILCKTSLDLIWFWLTVSGFGPMDLVQKQADVQESSGPLLANASELI